MVPPAPVPAKQDPTTSARPGSRVRGCPVCRRVAGSGMPCPVQPTHIGIGDALSGPCAAERDQSSVRTALSSPCGPPPTGVTDTPSGTIGGRGSARAGQAGAHTRYHHNRQARHVPLPMHGTFGRRAWVDKAVRQNLQDTVHSQARDCGTWLLTVPSGVPFCNGGKGGARWAAPDQPTTHRHTLRWHTISPRTPYTNASPVGSLRTPFRCLKSRRSELSTLGSVSCQYWSNASLWFAGCASSLSLFMCGENGAHFPMHLSQRCGPPNRNQPPGNGWPPL